VLNIFLLGLTSFFTDIASEMVYPLVPFFLTATLGAGPAVLGVIEGIAESIASLLRVYFGALSDRFRRRKAITIAGYGTSVLGRIFLATASAWGGVLGGRVIDRIGKGIRTAPRDALIAESAHHGIRGRVFGIHRGMDTAGAVVGVLIAMAVLSAGSMDYRRVILWSLVPACIGVLLLFLVKESHHPASERRFPGPGSWRALPPSLKRFLLVAFIFSLGNSSNTFLLLRAAGAGSVLTTALPAYLVYNICFMIAAYPAGRLSDSIGRRRVLAAGYAVYGLVYLGFALQGEGGAVMQVMTLFGIYGISSGLTDGVEKAFVADIAPSSLRATAIGLHGTVVGLGVLPASVIAGLLWDRAGASAPFLAGSALALIAATAMILVVRE
jgi:MFS family permease